MPNRPLTPDDAPALERFLYTRLESSLLLLNNLRASGIVDGAEPFRARYRASVSADGAITGVAAHCWNGMLLLQAPESAGTLAGELLGRGERPLVGIVGPVAQVEEALAAADAPRPPLKDSTEVLYALSLGELLPPESLVGGALAVRPATAADVDTVGGW